MRLPPGFFVTGTGTGVGKSLVACGLAYALRHAGKRVAAIKPFETGVSERADDAHALAQACALPHLADAPGLYRATMPAAPYAAMLAGEAAPPTPAQMLTTLADLCHDVECCIIEGAGGLLVPLDAEHSIADCIQHLQLPCVVVARNELGVLSHVLSLVEVARARGIEVAAVILSGASPADIAQDPSVQSNARVLRHFLDPIPVDELPFLADPTPDQVAPRLQSLACLQALLDTL